MPNEIWNSILQEFVKDFFSNIECQNLANFDQEFKEAWLMNSEFNKKLTQLKLVNRDFVHLIESKNFNSKIRKKIYQRVIDSKLIAVVKNNNEEIVERLIKLGADISV